jgi:hypothetical protein
MEPSTVRSALIGTVVAAALAACGGSGGTPQYQGLNPVSTSRSLEHIKHSNFDTCATSPPQYQWIFEGACQAIEITSSGAPFSLDSYYYKTVTGSIGHNDEAGTVQFNIVDAVNNDDIEHYDGMAFPHFTTYESGTTIMYVAVINQSNHNIKPVKCCSVPVFGVTVSDPGGLPAKTCGLAIYLPTTGAWDALYNVDGVVRNNSVTINWWDPFAGFNWPSEYPLYFAVYCPYPL